MIDTWSFRAYDARQARFFLEDYYNVKGDIESLSDNLRIIFKGGYDDSICYSQIIANAPFRCVWQSRSTVTVISAFAGQANLTMYGSRVSITPGISVCVSPSAQVEIETAMPLSMGVTRFDEEKVRSVCSAWGGGALKNSPCFSLAPFSPALNAQWKKILDLIMLCTNGQSVGWPAQALEDYAISLLISGHSHEISKFVVGETAVDAGAAAEAHAFIDDHMFADLTPLGVAKALGHPFPVLARGFREHRGITLRQAIYLSRRAGTNCRLSTSRNDDNTGRAREKIERLRLHIMESLSNSLRTEDLAAIVGVGPNRLRNLFRQAFELTPSQYILNERANWAHHLLIHTAKGIAEIADETGFSSQAHLNVVFRKKFGFTPGALRKSVL